MVVAIFRSRLNSEHTAAYYEMAARMRTLAEGMPGFISFKTFNAEDGERVSIIEFESEETLHTWRAHPEHPSRRRKGDGFIYTLNAFASKATGDLEAFKAPRKSKPITNETGPIEQIERQLSKLESTATNLQTISALAGRANRTQEAKALSDQAVDLRVKQFTLYRNKARLQVDAKEWKALVSALELVNHFIDEAIADLKVIKEVQDSAARLISVATKLAASFV